MAKFRLLCTLTMLAVLIGVSFPTLAIGELLGKSVAVTLKEGTFIQGTVTAEAEDSITIGSGDKAIVIKRDDIKEIKLVEVPQAVSPPVAQPNPETQMVNLTVTVDQLGWMAYGAPIKTFQAMGCLEQVGKAKNEFDLADLTSGLSLVLQIMAVLGPMVVPSGGTYQQSLTMVIIAGALGTVSDWIRGYARLDARAQVIDITQRYLSGQKTCFTPAKS